MATLSLTPVVHAQKRTGGNADCTTAIYIKDTVWTCEAPGSGHGSVLEIKDVPIGSKEWLEREHNTGWYFFRAPVTTMLTFDIIPKDQRDDIDFLVFRGAVPELCEKIAAKEVTPVRSNISRNDTSLRSMCGLSMDAAQDYVRSGVGSSYSKALEVESGELIYLLIDQPKPPRSGYTIHFHYGAITPPSQPEKPKQIMRVKITDAVSGKELNAAITVTGMLFDSIVEASGTSAYEFEMDPFREVRIDCLRQGYMLFSEKVPRSTSKIVGVDVALTPIAPDAQMVLEDIRFVGNEEKVLRSSQASLFLLLHFMEENPSTTIEVQGHVNGPTYSKNTKEFIRLSTARARMVHDFLVINDVDPSRVSYVGLGNSEMLFPEPKNKEESEANRRVEVRITGN